VKIKYKCLTQTQLGSLFGASSHEVGKWLVEVGLRDKKTKKPTDAAHRGGFCETAIKNSQPLFLGLAAMQKGVQDRRYVQLCEAREIYEHLAHRLGVLRESAKNEMLMILFAKNGYRSTAKSLFKLEFPQMADFIHKVKEKDHKRLARQMQEAERRFVIDTVCERLKRHRKEMFFTTIHDSLLARKTDCDLVVSVMKDEFARRGVHPLLEWREVGSSPQPPCG
jgi:hypothetical protein